MKEYMLLFWSDEKKGATLSPSEMQAIVTRWLAWVDSLKEQKLVEGRGVRLDSSRKTRTLKGATKLVSDGPFIESKEAIGGVLFIKARDIDQAVEIATGCPVFAYGGSVEIRSILAME